MGMYASTLACIEIYASPCSNIGGPFRVGYMYRSENVNTFMAGKVSERCHLKAVTDERKRAMVAMMKNIGGCCHR